MDYLGKRTHQESVDMLDDTMVANQIEITPNVKKTLDVLKSLEKLIDKPT